MTTQFMQQLTVQLKGGQTLQIPFGAEKAEVLNPQIEAFMKALGDKEKKNFVFQGARIVFIRLDDVSACEVMSFVKKEEEKKPKAKK